MGQGSIDNRIEQIQSYSNPFYATFRIGGLLDTRVGATSGGSGTADDDYALAARVNLGYQFPSSGNLGFSINYGGYADLHQE